MSLPKMLDEFIGSQSGPATETGGRRVGIEFGEGPRKVRRGLHQSRKTTQPIHRPDRRHVAAQGVDNTLVDFGISGHGAGELGCRVHTHTGREALIFHQFGQSRNVLAATAA